jgi:tetratricopeptide (TPR) repeat protein
MLGVSSPAMAAANAGDLAAYLKARAAEAQGSVGDAAADYTTALAADPNNPDIALRAYRTALDAGDYALADRALLTLQQAGVAPPDAAIVSLADAIHAGDKRAASAAIDRMGDTPLGFMAPVLKAWEAYDDGAADPVALLASGDASSIGRRYAAENRALLLIATGKTDDGVAAVRALLGPDQASFDLRIAAAQLLAAKGKSDLAQSVLAGADPVLTALRGSIGDGVKPSLSFGASRLFDRIASDLGHGDPSPLTVTLTRAALRIDPHDDRARLLLAQTLEQEDATDLSLAVLDGVDMRGPFASIARAARVAVLSDAGRDEQALAAAKVLADAPGATAEDAQRLGDAYVALEQYGEAARAYDMAITRAGSDADWAMYLQKGGALDESGDWAGARAALQKAVAMAPNEPMALNYLGYAELEHGEDLAGAAKLLEKASALKPGDPAITDSLGWAYVKLGHPDRALPLFERAVQGEPADVTINEHLGDAYWQTGRFVEARYAWRAASVTADGADKHRLADKIANGLGRGPVDH